MENMKKTIFEIVKKHVDELDYMGFLASECPDDEYDGESKDIADQIDTNMSVEDIANIIGKVFYCSFCVGVDISNPDDPQVIELDGQEYHKNYTSAASIWVAQKIYDDLQKLK